MNPYKYLDDNQLLLVLRTPDAPRALEVIYNKYWFKLYCWALKETHSKQLSEELVQIVFEKVWRNHQHVKIDNLGAYLAVSLKHTLLNLKRNEESARKINRLRIQPQANNTTENDVNAKILNESLERVLQTLPEKTQAIFRLSRYESMTNIEIAKGMDISQKTVEYHISRALKTLRIKLREYLNFFF